MLEQTLYWLASWLNPKVSSSFCIFFNFCAIHCVTEVQKGTKTQITRNETKVFLLLSHFSVYSMMAAPQRKAGQHHPLQMMLLMRWWVHLPSSRLLIYPFFFSTPDFRASLQPNCNFETTLWNCTDEIYHLSKLHQCLFVLSEILIGCHGQLKQTEKRSIKRRLDQSVKG